jgi:uncharacterized protein DUF4239
MMVQDWLLDLPLLLMALIIFGGTYLVVAGIWLVVTRSAVDDRGRAFKALSPGMLPPLGIIFGLLVGFTAAQVWSDFEKAKLAVSNEASALRSVIILAQRFPNEQGSRLRTLINEHIETAVNQEWPAMAQQRARLGAVPTKLVDALNVTLSLGTEEPGQKLAQGEIVRSIQTALDARRQRIIISQSTVSAVKWAGLLLQALCTLIAIAFVHSDNRATCAIALTLFATGVAASILLIECYNRPFTGEVSIRPYLLQQVIATEKAAGVP